MKEKISLAGDLGSGKSTVSAILTERIGAKYYSTGAIVRSIAEKRGMSVVELNVYMETHPEIDHEVDDGLKALSEVDELLIIDSRLAWHFTAGTFRIYLSTDIETSALRIMSANRKGEHSATLEQTIEDTRARRNSEKKRYMDQYGLDIKNLLNYDLVLDTTYATPEEIAECIIDSFERWKSDRAWRRTFISPERLKYPVTPADDELVSRLGAALECGEDIGTVSVVERDGDFFLVDGLEIALAYSFAMSTFIPATLVAGEPCGEFVQMKNSL